MGQTRTYQGHTYEQQADGTWRRIGAAQSGPQPVQVSSGDPMQPVQAQAQVGQTQAGTRNTNATATVTEATTPTTVVTANLPDGMMWVDPSNPAAGYMQIPRVGPARPNISDTQRTDAITALEDARAIRAGVENLRRLYREGPGSTQGIWAAQDLLPTEANRALNNEAQRLRGFVRRALGFTGGEANVQSEAEAIYGPYLPSASNYDSDIESKIAALEELANRAERQANGLLGNPVPETRPNAMTQTRFTTGETQLQASGDRGRTSTPIPPEMQQEYQSWVLQNATSMTPESYTAFRQELDRKYGFESGDYAPEAQRIIDGVRNGGTLNLTIPPVDQPMTGTEYIRDLGANNSFTAGAAGFTNMMGAGGVEALAGDQYNAMRDSYGGPMLAGEILGTLAPTAGIGGLGRMIASRAAPRLLGGGTAAAIGRSAAADAAYAGLYGVNTGQNPLVSATEGGVGSVAGQVLGRGVGRAFSGVTASAPVQALRSQGIPLTVGQTIGGVADRFEQRAMSIPVVGDMLRNRRIEGIEAFNQAAFREAGAPIGATTNAIGQEGLEQLGQSVSDAYTNATSGVQVPFDQQFATDFAASMQRANGLPADARRRLGQVLDVRVAPLTDNGAMTGYDYQQALRGLRSARNNPPQQFAGFEDIYKDRVTDVETALTDQMMRGGGDNVVQGLTAANAANRNLRTLEDAANRNLGGSNTEMPQVFMPNQLQRAGLRTQQNFPGPRPFADLADNAQQVLPSTIPNSGTADRLMQTALPAALAGGAGIGLLGGGDAQSAVNGAAYPAAFMALLAAASTRTGQRALSSAITQRNPTVREFGEFLRQGNVPLLGRSPSGLFGSGMFPIIRTEER